MGGYIGPKLKLSRSVGVPIAETSKHTNPRRTSRPGMHGFRPARRSLYGRQLTEKQKLAYYYNLRDRQLRLYMAKATRSKRPTPDALSELLETRLDNTLRRLGWARTIWQGRQLVNHGHIQVNGRRVDIPSFHVSAGDVITVKDKSKELVRNCMESVEERLIPGWLTSDDAKLEGKVERMPFPEDVRLPFDIEYSLVIEYYTR
jgi:small subunit ribosomal protein S4